MIWRKSDRMMLEGNCVGGQGLCSIHTVPQQHAFDVCQLKLKQKPTSGEWMAGLCRAYLIRPTVTVTGFRA